MADLFDAAVIDELWGQLPEECRQDRFSKATMPDAYRAAVSEATLSKERGWTACYLNFGGLPETMTKEIAWLIHREIGMGRRLHPAQFNAMTVVLRAAVTYGGKVGVVT